MSKLSDERMDALLRSTAQVENAALPLEDWKAQILARAAQDELPGDEAGTLRFAKPARKPLYQRVLPYACAAAGVVLLVSGILSMRMGASDAAPAAMLAAPAPAAYAAEEDYEIFSGAEPEARTADAGDADSVAVATEGAKEIPASGGTEPENGLLYANDNTRELPEQYRAAYEACYAYLIEAGVDAIDTAPLSIYALTADQMHAASALPGKEALLDESDWVFAFGSVAWVIADSATSEVIGSLEPGAVP